MVLEDADRLVADWCDLSNNPPEIREPSGWRICCVGQDFYFNGINVDLKFARKVDAEYAVQALVEAGFTHGVQIQDLADSEWVPIAISGLKW